MLWVVFSFRPTLQHYGSSRNLSLELYGPSCVYSTIVTCGGYVQTARFLNYTRGKLSRLTKLFQIELRQLIVSINFKHDSNCNT